MLNVYLSIKDDIYKYGLYFICKFNYEVIFLKLLTK